MDDPHHQHDDPDHCRDILAQLNDYLDGELAESLCRELEYHRVRLNLGASCRHVSTVHRSAG